VPGDQRVLRNWKQLAIVIHKSRSCFVIQSPIDDSRNALLFVSILRREFKSERFRECASVDLEIQGGGSCRLFTVAEPPNCGQQCVTDRR